MAYISLFLELKMKINIKKWREDSKMNRINVTRASLPSFDEFIDEIRPIWESAWLTNMGALHKEFEAQLKNYLKVSEVSLFVNGHMALEMALQAMNLEGEVITTPFTFASTTHAIVRNGLTPVFCDINEKDFTIDVSKIESLITEKTSAIVPVHIYGNVCDVKAIDAIAKKYRLKVIYDAAHSFGVTVDGIGIGNFGDASVFSFHATKVFNSIEGGAVTFSDQQLGRTLYQLKNFGIMSETEVEGIGANAKMNEFQAAMGICNLRHINEDIAKRKVLAERYRNNLSGIKGLTLLEEQKNVISNYSYFPIIIQEEFEESRDDLYYRLREHNIYTRRYFYPLTSQFECYRGRFDVDATPIARYISERILVLPLYADLSIEIIDSICDILKQRSN